MGNGVSKGLFLKSKIRTLLELDVNCNFFFDPNLNKYTERLVVDLRLWSVKKNEDGELTTIITEYGWKTILLNHNNDAAVCINAEIQKMLEIAQVDFSKFKSLDLTYRSPIRIESITLEKSSVEDFKDLCKYYLEPWIIEECAANMCEDTDQRGSSTNFALMK